MNRRIQELAQQSMRPFADEDDLAIIEEVDLNKFAQLIVQDCVLIARTSTDGFSAGRRMEEHFGVL